MFLVDLITEGCSTAVVVTLDTAVDESRKKMADRLTWSPARLCSTDGKVCYYRRLEYEFLLSCLASLFSYFSSSLSENVSLRVGSSAQQSSSASACFAYGD